MCGFHSPFVVALAGATALLGACGKNGGARVPTSGPAQSGDLPPDSEAIYERSSKNCRSMPTSRAPQTGDARAWAPLITRCADSLPVHTFNGYKSMPPTRIQQPGNWGGQRALAIFRLTCHCLRCQEAQE